MTSNQNAVHSSNHITKLKNKTIINFPYFKLQYNKTIKNNYNVVLS